MQPPKHLAPNKSGRVSFSLTETSPLFLERVKSALGFFPRPHRSARYWHPPPATQRQDGRTSVPSQDECKRFCQSNHWWGSLKILQRWWFVESVWPFYINLKTLIYFSREKSVLLLTPSIPPSHKIPPPVSNVRNPPAGWSSHEARGYCGYFPQTMKASGNQEAKK